MTENKNMLERGYDILGHVYFSLGDYDKAIEFYKLGLTIAQETGDKHSEGHAWIHQFWQSISISS